MKKYNPFIISGYQGAKYFCDREKETAQLMRNCKNQINTSLFAFRRLGKTGLLKHTLAKLKRTKKFYCIYIDILGTTELDEFTNELATAIYNAFPPNKSAGKKILNLITSLRPTITYNALSGAPVVSVTSSTQQQKVATLKQLFNFIDLQDKPVVLAIDEFQQILEYPEKNVEAILRTQTQFLENTTFIYCGSHQKMMHQIFDSAKRPFFGSCTPMNLDFIEKEKYKSFIKKTLTSNQRKITDDAVTFICDWTMTHTYYTQYFCHFLFAKQIITITLEDVRQVAMDISKIHEGSFYQYRSLLTAAQWKLLQAIAIEQKLFHPNSNAFLSAHNLGSASGVNRAMEALLNKDMIYYDASVPKPYYSVYDKFLMRWIQTE